jgi:hypothetical protein
VVYLRESSPENVGVGGELLEDRLKKIKENNRQISLQLLSLSRFGQWSWSLTGDLLI